MAEARHALLRHFGYGEFRPAQSRVLEAVFAGLDTLAVLPTGGGKSVCFQVPAVVRGGLTIVVSPLISLMQDQVAAAVGRGIPAACLTSGLASGEQSAIWENLRARGLRLLYVSPERMEGLVPRLRSEGIRPELLAIDEAHCISEWGHDFRPSYRLLRAARYKLGNPQTIALTGSATPEVRKDIVQSLGFATGRHAIHIGSFDRANLWLGVVPVRDEAARFDTLVRLLGRRDRLAIVYASTRGVTESLARALFTAGYKTAPYHAGLTRARRAATLAAFLQDQVGVIVATCAFGMGIDKPDVRLVVHWTAPPTPESYYQEAGRAGRDGVASRCLLLWRRGDTDVHRRQLEVTFPPRRLLERVWSGTGVGVAVTRSVRESCERLRRELRPERGPPDWGPVRERRRRAEARIAAVESYALGQGCRRRALIGYFGEHISSCSGCDLCEGRRHGARRLLAFWRRG